MDNVESNTGFLVGMVCFATVFKRFVVKEECCMGVVGLTLHAFVPPSAVLLRISPQK